MALFEQHHWEIALPFPLSGNYARDFLGYSDRVHQPGNRLSCGIDHRSWIPCPSCGIARKGMLLLERGWKVREVRQSEGLVLLCPEEPLFDVT